MSKRIPEQKVEQIKKLFVAGFSHYEIMRVVGVSYSTVYLYCIHNRQELAILQQCLDPDEIWTKQDKQRLSRLYQLFPDDWEESKAFKIACHELAKTPDSVEDMIRGMQLGMKKGEKIRKKKIQAIEWEEPKKPKFRRPDPVYTNIPTPIGNAERLHAGNRIFMALTT